jgi:hypothetical protein
LVYQYVAVCSKILQIWNKLSKRPTTNLKIASNVRRKPAVITPARERDANGREGEAFGCVGLGTQRG